MKTLKCTQCSLRFRDRHDPKDSEDLKYYCWNCRFCAEVIQLTCKTFELHDKINRRVFIALGDIHITKRL